MIKVDRTAKPAILIRKEIEWMQAIRDATTLLIRNKAIDKYKHKTIKNHLSKMFHGKCAYCESYIEHVDYGDIEHYKPKSKFPLHAVQWRNLLLSCKKCNGAGQKGDEWPSRLNGGLLINPCDEEPSDYFDFIFDTTTQVTIVRPKNRRGITSERIYGLNKTSLLKHRNSTVKRLIALAQYYNSDPVAKKYLDEATNSDEEYSAFAKMIKENFIPGP